MKVLFSIIINALILFIITYLLAWNSLKWIPVWVIAIWWWKTYMVGGIILWLLNLSVKPLLKLFSLPLFFFFYGLSMFILNGVILKLFTYILNDILLIDWMSYKIEWLSNFIIAVAIFTFLNMIYSLLFFKK